MLNTLLHKYNKLRKQNLLRQLLPGIERKYAFVGAGLHSISTLYPILKFLSVPIKYIVTHQSDPGHEIKSLFPDAVFTRNLKDVTDDREIAGIFVCTNASRHYDILSVLLRSGKNIFVEKPPCSNLEELNSLITLSKGNICKVGLQRRYWPANQLLKQILVEPSTYVYRFRTGSYPQGDELTELFIHPLDYINFLFGNFELLSSLRKKTKSGIVYHLHVSHNNGISGLVELSTSGSWNHPLDELIVDCQSESVSINYPISVSAISKPKRIMNIPSERVLKKPLIAKTYFSTGNLIVPAADLNTFMLQGFFQELHTFLMITEGKPEKKMIGNDLEQLINIYQVMDQLRKD